MHFYAWKSGLKTGMYYLRTKPKAHAIQFTVDQVALAAAKAGATADTEGALTAGAGSPTPVKPPMAPSHAVMNAGGSPDKAPEAEADLSTMVCRRRRPGEVPADGEDECLVCSS